MFVGFFLHLMPVLARNMASVKISYKKAAYFAEGYVLYSTNAHTIVHNSTNALLASSVILLSPK